jgi:ABC-2 type transport system permease protein
MIFARTLAIMHKEFLHIARDPRTLVLVFVIPIVQLFLLGYAATTDVEHIATAVLDADRSAGSRALVNSYEATGYFDFTASVSSQAEIRNLMDSGEVRAALVIPPAYSDHVTAGEHVEIGFIVDGSDPAIANSATSAALQTGQALAQRLAIRLFGEQRGGLEVRPMVWYNPDLRSANFMIPAVMGIILQFMSTLLTSMAIVREREQSTMEQIIVTPIKPGELIVGKVAPYVVLTFFDLVEVLLIGTLVFDVPIRGSLSLLLALSILFLVGSLAVGILISTAANTQMEAMMLSFLFLMPSIFLSGFFFPLDAMPLALQGVSYIVPLRYMLIITRSIILKGVGLEILRSQVLALVIFGVIVITMAARRFRKRLD